MKKLFIASLCSLLFAPILFAQQGNVGPDRYHWSGNPNSVDPNRLRSLNPPIGITLLNTQNSTQYFKLSPMGDNSAYAMPGDFILPSGVSFTLFTTSTSPALTGTTQYIAGQTVLFGTNTYTIGTRYPYALASGAITTASSSYTCVTIPIDTSGMATSLALTSGTVLATGNPYLFKSYDVLVLSSSLVSAAPVIQAQALSLVSTGSSFVTGTTTLTLTGTLTGTASGNYQSFGVQVPATDIITAGNVYTTSTSNALTGSNQFVSGMTNTSGTNIYTIATTYQQPAALQLVVSSTATLSSTNGFLNVETFWRGYKAN